VRVKQGACSMLPTSLLATKISIPPARPEWISRPRLLERLDQASDCRLVLISAPAGYGKTTLLSA
jgi:LuxR family transcriptional regulator, maltose regulon positive regulatory protein